MALNMIAITALMVLMMSIAMAVMAANSTELFVLFVSATDGSSRDGLVFFW